ncbi:DUF4178 domain-containing protein [Pontibacter ruber]|uniref:DUF4178 domain-containing protein n=1 Tax=Pontibacter ruber TaxID=1343895 RepID=A0ABW5CUU3_9BACT|nr:DUF4178 domain-containing protein [Pontibacter ruber]
MSGFDLVEKEKLPAVAAISCTRCNHNIQLTTHAQAVNIGCSNCGHVLQWQNNQWAGIKNLKQHKILPAIPVGSSGRIKGIVYKVVGFVLYQEARSQHRWREYVLFNPLHGYAFLSEYDGHWTYFTFITDLPLKPTRDRSMHYQGEKYKLFHRYGSKVLYAEGEFTWKILENASHYTEFVAPPYMLAQETSSDEACWMKGTYMEPGEVRETFGLTSSLPERIGVGAIEPFDKAFSFGKVSQLGGIALVMLVVLQVFFMIVNRPQQLVEQSFDVPPPKEEYGPVNLSAIPGPSFTLNSMTGTSNLEFELYAPVDNEWFALGITLINTTTNEAYDFELGTEYYSGYTGGESWSEGSTTNDVDLSAMPDGTYRMILQPYKGILSKVNSFRIQVRKDVPLWSNFWIVLLLLAVVPGVQWIRHHSFEKSRWMNSDYSPYTYE